MQCFINSTIAKGEAVEDSTDEDEDWVYLTLRDAVDLMEQRMGIRIGADLLLATLGRMYRPACNELLPIHLEDVEATLWFRKGQQRPETSDPPVSSIPSDDSSETSDPDPTNDSPETLVPPETAQEPPPEVPGANPEERGTAVTDFLAEAAAGGPNRNDEVKAFVGDINKVVAAGERKLFGLRVVVLVDGKIVTGDVEETVRGLYHYIAGDNGVALTANDVNLFINFCVVVLGDSEAVRKTAKAVFEKKGS